VLLIVLVFALSYYVSLRSEFRVVMPVTISAYKRCSVRLYRLYLMYVICVCFVFPCLVYPMLPVSMGFLFLIVTSVFSDVYLDII
jgi:hypothetical protein